MEVHETSAFRNEWYPIVKQHIQFKTHNRILLKLIGVELGVASAEDDTVSTWDNLIGKRGEEPKLTSHIRENIEVFGVLETECCIPCNSYHGSIFQRFNSVRFVLRNRIFRECKELVQQDVLFSKCAEFTELIIDIGYLVSGYKSEVTAFDSKSVFWAGIRSILYSVPHTIPLRRE